MASRRLVASLGVLLLPLLLLSSLVAAVAATKGGVEVVADDDWRKILEGEWMVEFYAPWCPACQQLQPEWVKLAAWSKDLNIRVGKVDITLQTAEAERFPSCDMALCSLSATAYTRGCSVSMRDRVWRRTS
ncbi:unnamed protein product [Lampetra planeri]